MLFVVHTRDGDGSDVEPASGGLAEGGGCKGRSGLSPPLDALLPVPAPAAAPGPEKEGGGDPDGSFTRELVEEAREF